MNRWLAVSSCALVLSFAPPARADVTRTLALELSGDPSRPFAVENLAGRMTVVPATGGRLLATATVHADSAEMAALVRFEQVAGKGGVPTLRVRFPVDRHKTYRYGDGEAESDGVPGWVSALVGILSRRGNDIDYDGARVQVSGSTGIRLWVDVEVQVPDVAIDGRFDTRVGAVSGRVLRGRAALVSGSGEAVISDSSGTLSVTSGSGRVGAHDVRGALVAQTGSGDCDVSGFAGRDVRCTSGSGNVTMTRLTTARVGAETGSGNVLVTAADAQDVQATTGSGNVHLVPRGNRLRRVTGETGSGNVGLTLAAGTSFDLRADTGSGNVVSRLSDAETIREGSHVVGYRRGQGGARIELTTGSGNVLVE